MERTEAEWREVLHGCNFEMARDKVSQMLAVADHEATQQSGAYDSNTAAAISKFLDQPSMATAVLLLQSSPVFYAYFEGCCPGGVFYRVSKLSRRFRQSSEGQPD